MNPIRNTTVNLKPKENKKILLGYFLTSLIFGLAALVPFNASQVTADAGVEIWWPTPGASVSGVQPFKAMLKDSQVENYNMFWQVDDGQLNYMASSYEDYPHKEASVDLEGWNWRGSGPYNLKFKAFDFNNNLLGQAESYITIQSGSVLTSVTETVVPTPLSQSAIRLTSANISVEVPALVPASEPRVENSSNLFMPVRAELENTIRNWEDYRPEDAKVLKKLRQPTAIWLGGWNKDLKGEVNKITTQAENEGKVAVFVAYNIPLRDCGGYSAGGEQGMSMYLSWVKSLSEGIVGPSIVILEPDALALMDCLNSEQKYERYVMLKEAAAILKSKSGTKVYLDAGHSTWIEAKEMAARLKMAGIAQSDGFALNVSNFSGTLENLEYGRQISKNADNKNFVIDTGRSGSGANGEWCNPSNRSLGQNPTLQTGQSGVDAYLWIKPPGDSDGNCNGGPNAGVFWPEYALSLAQLSR